MMTSVIINFRDKREVNINTNYAITGCMLCVIPHSCKDYNYNSHRYHRNQVKYLYRIFFVTYQITNMGINLDTFYR